MAIAGYGDTGPTDEQLKDMLEELLTRPSFLDERVVETKMGRSKMRCTTISNISLAVRARTGRHHTNAQMIDRLHRLGFDTYTAYRGQTPMTVVIPRPALRVVGGMDLQQTG